MEAIASLDAEVARAIFSSPKTIALGGWPAATTGLAWASCRDFARAVREGTIDATVRAVLYDPEAWDATPVPERRDPVRHIEAFSRLARSQGYFVIVTPHSGLVDVPGSRHRRAEGEDQEAAYLRSGILREAALNADACEVQAQRHQRLPSRYREVVLAAARQARDANPDVVVLSGLSTHPGYPATAEMLYAAWRSVRDVVDGHYLSLARLRCTEAAASFLRMVAEDDFRARARTAGTGR